MIMTIIGWSLTGLLGTAAYEGLGLWATYTGRSGTAAPVPLPRRAPLGSWPGPIPAQAAGKGRS